MNCVINRISRIIKICIITTFLAYAPATLASAATVSQSTSSFDFGLVAVGSQSTLLSVQFDVILGPDENFTSASWFVPSGFEDPSFRVGPVSGCTSSDLSCTVSYFFAPYNLLPAFRFSTHSPLTAVFFSMGNESGGHIDVSINHTYSIALRGTGYEPSISAAPIPPSIALFASGLSALGLLGWRRKRKKAAAAA